MNKKIMYKEDKRYVQKFLFTYLHGLLVAMTNKEHAVHHHRPTKRKNTRHRTLLILTKMFF